MQAELLHSGTIVPTILGMVLGRPISFDTDEVIDRATQVFWSQGYTATSMADLLAATRLSRSSLYETFAGKEALFRRCLQHYADVLAGSLASQLEQTDDARGFIRQTFLQFARQADAAEVRQGCFAMNTAVELGHTDSELAGEAQQSIQRFRRVFEQAIRQAQSQGTISTDKDAAALAQYLVASMSGLRMLIQCGATPDEAERTVQIMLRPLD